MKNFVVATLAVAALGGSALALAAAAAPGDAPPPPGDAREVGGFMLDAHLAGMKAALKLTPDQEKNWAAFEASVREAAQARRDAMQAMRDADARRRASLADRAHEHDGRPPRQSLEPRSRRSPTRPSRSTTASTTCQRRHFGPLMATLIEHGPHHGAMMGPGGMMEHGGMMMGPHGGDGPHGMGPQGDRPGDTEED